MKPVSVLVVWVVWIVALFLAGCSGNPHSIPSGIKVILITDVGGLGDKGFNDAGWAGCQWAHKRLADQGKSIDIQFIESEEQTDYISNLNLAAERADIVVALGFMIADAVQEVAPHYPDTHFIFVDGQVTGDNVFSVTFRTNEAAFLAGILASYVSRTGVVGVIPGMDIPPVDAFAVGFRAGIMMGGAIQQKDVKSLSTTIGSFDDPVKAKSIAISLMDQNADVLLQLAGNSGLGVIEAVKDSSKPVWAIGVDIDQDDLAPGKILTSILKRMDKVVADQIVASVQGEFKSGQYDMGLQDQAVGLTDMRHTQHLLSEEVKQVLNKAERLIVDHTILVPRTYSELDSFVVSHVDVLKPQ